MECSKKETTRRSPRLSVDMKGRLVGRASWEISIVDLSLCGCLVRCPALLDGGAIVDVELEVGGRELLVKGRVISASLDGAALPGSQCYLVALEFLSLPAHEGADLRHYLDGESRRRAGPA
jgi:hypothetical protein